MTKKQSKDIFSRAPSSHTETAAQVFALFDYIAFALFFKNIYFLPK